MTYQLLLLLLFLQCAVLPWCNSLSHHPFTLQHLPRTPYLYSSKHISSHPFLLSSAALPTTLSERIGGTGRPLMASVMAALGNLMIRACIGAVGVDAVRVEIDANSNQDALLGKWRRLAIVVGEDCGRLFRIKRAKALGTDLEIGLGPARLLAMLLVLFTWKSWPILGLYLIVTRAKHADTKAGDHAKSHGAVQGTMAISSKGLNSPIPHAALQLILTSLMRNSVLAAALNAATAPANGSGSDINALQQDRRRLSEATSFKLRSVSFVEGGQCEFDADAVFGRTQKDFVASSLNFKLRTTVRPDTQNKKTLVFEQPALKADFTDSVQESLRPLGATGRIFAKFLPKVAYLPVGAACGVSVPFLVEKLRFDPKEDMVQLEIVLDMNNKQIETTEGLARRS